MIDDHLAIISHKLKFSMPEIQIIYTYCQWKISKYGILYPYLSLITNVYLYIK